jgi:hypothetical protein
MRAIGPWLIQGVLGQRWGKKVPRSFVPNYIPRSRLRPGYFLLGADVNSGNAFVRKSSMVQLFQYVQRHGID